MQSVNEPTHGVIQELEETLQVLNPAYAEATTFLEKLKPQSAKDTKKLTSLCHRPAPEVIGDLANTLLPASSIPPTTSHSNPVRLKQSLKTRRALEKTPFNSHQQDQAWATASNPPDPH
eukprot:1152304-Pelagomonas_calceolata.AAC.1